MNASFDERGSATREDRRQFAKCWSLAVLPLFFLSPVYGAEQAAPATETPAAKILFIAGNPSHGYGSHEHYAGCRILADLISSANLGVETQVVRGWPSDAGLLEQADTIVIYSDGGGGHLAIPHFDQLKKLMDAGKGLVCLHYAVEVPKGEIGDRFIKWLGGYFETHWSVNPHWVANFDSLPNSPISQGVQPFAANDEWYFHMRFPEDMAGVTPILQAIPPESTMRRPDGPHSGNPVVRRKVAEQQPQVVAWAFERPQGGRSFGFTGGHYHWNWGRQEMQRLVGNAILWTAGVEVPEGGVKANPLGVSRLRENQDYQPPGQFNPEKVADEFKLGSVPIRPAGESTAAAEKADQAQSGKRLFQSPVITSKTPGHAVEIEVSLAGAKELFLIVNDAGDGFACDWANWLDPVLVGPSGTLSLMDLDWQQATSQWGQVRKGKNAGGQELSVAGEKKTTGIGAHANSVIHFKIPEGYGNTFKATGALDTGGTQQNNGASSSVKFLVYADAVPADVNSGSSTDNPARLAENALAGLEWPADLDVTLAASEPALRSLTNLDIDDRGRIWVIDVVNYRGNNGRRPEGDRILILEDTNQDGVADEMTVFYQGRDIDSAMGLCVLGNEVIVSAAPYIWRFTDEDGDDRADKKVAMFTDTGVPQHDHSNHSFLFGPDGKLYWNVGNTGKAVKDANGQVVVDIHGRPIIDNGQPFFGGMPFRCDLSGDNMEVLAHNFRNNWETTVDSFGTLWQSDNDDDGNRGVRINFVMEHGNYGYRDTIDGSGWGAERIGWEAEIPLRHWHLNDPGVVPNLLQTGAGSPTGITVYEGRLLPERFWDQMIHCDAGPNVVRSYPVKPDGAGYSAETLPLLTGTEDKWFRPADVCVAPDGSLFVTDWYDPGVGGHRQEDLERGRLFRIAPPGSKYVIPKFDYSTAEGAAAALTNPNHAVRYRAWTALHAMGVEAEKALLKLWSDENPRIRARALWLLGKIPGREQHYVDLALQDSDSDIRVTAIRLARQNGVSLADVVARVTKDPSAAVLREAAVALRFCEAPQVPELWAQLANRYQVGDRWYLEALGIGSEAHPAACFTAWLKTVGGDWENSAAATDLVWRVRADQAAEKMGQLLSNPQLPLEATDRYFRSLEFHTAEARAAALRPVVLRLAQQPASERNDAVIVRSLERIEQFDWRANAAISAAVERHIERAAGTPAYLALVKFFRPANAAPQLLALALANSENSSGVEATRLLLQLDAGRELVVAELAKDETAPAMASLLGLLGNQQAVRLVTPLVQATERPYAVRAAATRTMAGNNFGADALLNLVAKKSLPGDAKLLAAGLLSRSQDAAIRQRAAELLPLPTQADLKPLPAVDQLAAMRGDVARGRQLFREKATCANCHIVDKFGKQVGPDLSEIGDKLSREAMFISILDPSAGISHNYENYICLLVSGQVIAGVKVSETEDKLILRTAEAIDREISKQEIDELKLSEKSIMPENLHHAFDQQGLVDIVEYMTTLRKAAN